MSRAPSRVACDVRFKHAPDGGARIRGELTREEGACLLRALLRTEAERLVTGATTVTADPGGTPAPKVVAAPRRRLRPSGVADVGTG